MLTILLLSFLAQASDKPQCVADLSGQVFCGTPTVVTLPVVSTADQAEYFKARDAWMAIQKKLMETCKDSAPREDGPGKVVCVLPPSRPGRGNRPSASK